MIILITGPSHVGKTLLAQKLIEKHCFSCLSIDHLKMGLIRSGQTDLTAEDDDALTEYLWPIVREMIKTAVENRQNMIVEGCYVPFDWRRDFEDDYLKDIRFICLAFSGEYIDAHFDDIRDHASAIERRLDESWLNAEVLKEENMRCIEGFLKAGEKVTEIEDDYRETICRIAEEKL